jgi:small subunit ribosomal protein S6e
MAEFRANISDPKTGKSYQKQVGGNQANAILGKKIGDKIDGIFVEMPGYKLEITGGSDKDGFPMRRDLPGPRRKKLLISKGMGFNPHMEGERRKKTMRGTQVSPDIVQINMKVVTRGPRSVEELLGKKQEGANEG